MEDMELVMPSKKSLEAGRRVGEAGARRGVRKRKESEGTEQPWAEEEAEAEPQPKAKGTGNQAEALRTRGITPVSREKTYIGSFS